MIAGPNVGKRMHFRGLNYGRKINSMENSSNMKFTHNLN